MKSKKKIDFRKNTEWLYSDPVELEHKQYLLLDFLKKCDEKIEKFELYPLYSEVSLQLANIHAINSEFKTLYHEKVFKSNDDEILDLSPLFLVALLVAPTNGFRRRLCRCPSNSVRGIPCTNRQGAPHPRASAQGSSRASQR